MSELIPMVEFQILDKWKESPYNLMQRASDGSAGYDMRAMTDDIQAIDPGETILVGTGIRLHIDNTQIAAVLLPRSGLGHKNGIVLGNLVGLIDSDYQGEVKISAWNRSKDPYLLHPYTKLCQMIFIPVIHPAMQLAESFAQTERADGGFGHSGII